RSRWQSRSPGRCRCECAARLCEGQELKCWFSSTSTYQTIVVDDAITDFHAAFHPVGNARVMGDQNQCGAGALDNCGKHLHDFMSSSLIQCTGGLIGEDDRG